MGKKNRKQHKIERESVQENDKEKFKDNKKIILLSAVFLLLTGLILVFAMPLKNKQQPYKPDNIDISVTTNDDGAQEPNAGVQKDVMTNEGAATVDDITGGVGNPANQGQGIEKMLEDKEIELDN